MDAVVHSRVVNHVRRMSALAVESVPRAITFIGCRQLPAASLTAVTRTSLVPPQVSQGHVAVKRALIPTRFCCRIHVAGAFNGDIVNLRHPQVNNPGHIVRDSKVHCDGRQHTKRLRRSVYSSPACNKFAPRVGVLRLIDLRLPKRVDGTGLSIKYLPYDKKGRGTLKQRTV